MASLWGLFPPQQSGWLGSSWCLLNVLCLLNCSFPGSSWCGVHSMGDFSEAQPQGAVTVHQREVPEGAWAFSEPRLHLCRHQPSPKADGPVIHWKEKRKKGKRKENRAREENKEMFQDSNKNKREHIPLIGAVFNYLLTKISWKFKNLFQLLRQSNVHCLFQRHLL